MSLLERSVQPSCRGSVRMETATLNYECSPYFGRIASLGGAAAHACLANPISFFRIASLLCSSTAAFGTDTADASSATLRRRGANFGFQSSKGTLRAIGWLLARCAKRDGG